MKNRLCFGKIKIFQKVQKCLKKIKNDKKMKKNEKKF